MYQVHHGTSSCCTSDTEAYSHVPSFTITGHLNRGLATENDTHVYPTEIRVGGSRLGVGRRQPPLARERLLRGFVF